MARTQTKKRPAGNDANPQAKQPRALAPDITVVVGGVEFKCYKIALCFASNYFDTMLSAGMREDRTSRIELPDKDPEEWKQFYKIIDPRQIGEVRTESLINEDNAVMLTPWFHEFQMEAHLKQCDDILSCKVERISNWANKDTQALNKSLWPFTCDNTRDRFRELLDLLRHACKYGLLDTKGEAEATIGALLSDHLCESQNLFDVSSVRVLVSLCLPVTSTNSGFVSGGACTHLWTGHFSIFLVPHIAHLTADMINSNDMFPLLLHSYMQQCALKEKLLFSLVSETSEHCRKPKAHRLHRYSSSDDSNSDDSNSDSS